MVPGNVPSSRSLRDVGDAAVLVHEIVGDVYLEVTLSRILLRRLDGCRPAADLDAAPVPIGESFLGADLVVDGLLEQFVVFADGGIVLLRPPFYLRRRK